MQLFALLGFKSGSLTKETVTLAHFLDKADLIIANVEKIKALDATVWCSQACCPMRRALLAALLVLHAMNCGCTFTTCCLT